MNRERLIPILEDVRHGNGGRAGGKFLWTNDDVTPSSIVATGTAQSGGSNQIQLSASASSVDDFYNGYSLQITGGTGEGQDYQRIVDYVGATKTADLSGEWVTTPDSTSTYRIVNRGY